MLLLRRRRDPKQRAELEIDMATEEVLSDEERVLAVWREQELPTWRAKSSKASGCESDGVTPLRGSMPSAGERTNESHCGVYPPSGSLTWPHAVLPCRND